MNVISTVVIATALVAVCDVSQAAEPAAVKSIGPQALASENSLTASTSPNRQNELATVAVSTADSVPDVRQQGRAALVQIQQEALNQNWSQYFVLPMQALPADGEPVLVSDELIAEASERARQLAVK